MGNGVLGVFSAAFVLCPNDVYLLAGDEVVISKAGKKTYGLDRFFSSLISKPISGLSFFTLIQHYIYLTNILTPIIVLVRNTEISWTGVIFLGHICVKVVLKKISKLIFIK